MQIEGFEIKGCKTSGIAGYNNTNIRIVNNKIHHMGRRCVNGEGGQGSAGGARGYITVDNNIAHTNGRLHYGEACLEGETGCTNGVCLATVGYKTLDHAFYLSCTDYAVFTNNIFYGNRSGWSIDISKGSDYFWVINNTFYNCKPQYSGVGGGCILIWPEPDGKEYLGADKISDHIIIQNNIFHNPALSAIHTTLKPADLGYQINDSNISNNIIYGTTHVISMYTDPLTYLDTTTQLNSHGNNFGNTIAGNIFGQDPLFVSAPNDFRLASNLSPAINTGLAINAPAVDIAGQNRVGNPDSGAYEYVSPVDEKIIYVDNTAQNCSDGVTNYNPITKSCGIGAHKMFKTIQGAANVVTAGDTVYVRGGTYAGFIVNTKHGTLNSWITFKNYSNETAIIDSYITADCSNVNSKITLQIYKSTYIEINGFEITSTHR